MGNADQQVTLSLDYKNWLPAVTAVAPILAFLAVYAPVAGLGFVRDDYPWILQSRIGSAGDLLRVLSTDIGFYRPVVGLTFAFNHWLFGSASTGYGLTNVALALGCAGGVAWVARALSLPLGAAILAGALWLLHPGAMPISVLWISGRTALVMILAATASAAALMRGRLPLALACLAIALLAKEEAVLLPLVLFGWLLVASPPPVRPLTWALTAGAVEALYFLARTVAGSTNPINAPSFYRFAFDPAVVLGNASWYLSHASWPAAVCVALAVIVLRPGSGSEPQAPRLEPYAFRLRPVLLSGGLWIVGSCALTMLLPVRSHLYLALPAVGASLGAAAICAWCWTAAPDGRRRAALVPALLGVAAVLVPLHVRGVQEWTMRTEFAATMARDLEALTAGLPDGSHVVLADDRNDPRGNLASVFGTMASDAGLLVSGRPLEVWIEPPPPHAGAMGLRPPCADCVAVRLMLVDGRLRRAPSP
jgi:hypothetical protein